MQKRHLQNGEMVTKSDQLSHLATPGQIQQCIPNEEDGVHFRETTPRAKGADSIRGRTSEAKR